MTEEQCCKRSLVGSLWDSAKRFVKDPIPVPREISDWRMIQCDMCDKLKNGICQECGCVVKLKTKFSEMECPIGKWGKYEQL
jgi:hypothetical protein